MSAVAFPASRGLLHKQRHSPADRHSTASPGESGFLDFSYFPRKPLFHCSSGGIRLPRLFLFPPQTTISLLLRGNLASSPIPISPANRYFPAPPGKWEKPPQHGSLPPQHGSPPPQQLYEPSPSMRTGCLTSRRYLPTASPEAYVTQRASSRAARRHPGRIEGDDDNKQQKATSSRTRQQIAGEKKNLPSKDSRLKWGMKLCSMPAKLRNLRCNAIRIQTIFVQQFHRGAGFSKNIPNTDLQKLCGELF